MMLRSMWKWYQQCLTSHPGKTQIICSGILWGIGDIGAQYITYSASLHKSAALPSETYWTVFTEIHLKHFFGLSKLGKRTNLGSGSETLKDADADFKINWKRVGITSMFGFGFVGPVGHFWYEGLDKIIRLKLLLEPKSFRFVASKVAADGLIFGPFDLFVFFTYMGFANGKNTTQVKEDLFRDFLPALILEGGIWPVVQVVNFRYVPVRYQLLYVNIFCLLDSVFLSWLEQQNDAPWKQWFTPFHSLEEQDDQR